MLKNRRYICDAIRSPKIVIAVIFFILVLGGCARSYNRTDTSDASDGPLAETEDSGVAILDANQGDGSDNLGVSDNSFLLSDSEAGSPIPDVFDIAPPPTRPSNPPKYPVEIQEAMDRLDEPDFTQPLEELTTESCGYIFKAESEFDWVNHFSLGESTFIPKVTVETRSFDRAGQLVAAEIEWDTSLDSTAMTPIRNKRRLQIDYDQSARPVRVRISPAINPGVNMFSGAGDSGRTYTGSVIETIYNDDGSSQSLYITDEVELVANLFGAQFGSRTATNGWYFCDWLRFDPYGNLIERKWDCTNPTAVQTRIYDERQRLLSDRGFYLYEADQSRALPLEWIQSLQQGEWRIELSYDDANHHTTMVWLGPEDSRTYAWVSGMAVSRDPIEHRLVHTYDNSGQRLIRTDYDHENDGSFDEQVSYTYEGDKLLSKEVDFWNDGVVDIAEIHTRSVNHHRIERRNMTQSSDIVYSSQTFEDSHIGRSFVDSTATLPARSQSIIDMEYDNQSRPIAIDVEIQWMTGYTDDIGQIVELMVSESWRETSVYTDEGYAREKKLVWETSDGLLEVQEHLPGALGKYGAPLYFLAAGGSTACSLIPLCESAEIVLPEDKRLLACEVGVVFPQYRVVTRMPSISQDEIYVVPPYDSLPGMQNAMRRDIGSFAYPRAPYVQDIVDYF